MYNSAVLYVLYGSILKLIFSLSFCSGEAGLSKINFTLKR
jgi:hypothetical protein